MSSGDLAALKLAAAMSGATAGGVVMHAGKKCFTPPGGRGDAEHLMRTGVVPCQRPGGLRSLGDEPGKCALCKGPIIIGHGARYFQARFGAMGHEVVLTCAPCMPLAMSVIDALDAAELLWALHCTAWRTLRSPGW